MRSSSRDGGRRGVGRALARALVSVVGTLPAAWLGGAALALWWPASGSVAHSVGFVATLPLWVLAMTLAFLDERVWRAALAATVAAVLAFGAILLQR